MNEIFDYLSTLKTVDVIAYFGTLTDQERRDYNAFLLSKLKTLARHG